MIRYKNPEQIALLHEGGQKLGRITAQLAAAVRPGVTTADLEELLLQLIAEAGGAPAFKGYKSSHRSRAFPTALCASINQQIVHGPAIPGRVLKSGDIISLDLGMEYPLKKPGIVSDWPINPNSPHGGYFTDMAVTVPIGKVSQVVQKLINTTRQSLQLAIAQALPGNTLLQIAQAIQSFVEKRGFSVVRDLVGHGVGLAVHEDPQIPHYVCNQYGEQDIVLKPGMVIAIEPMISLGSPDITTGRDGFSFETIDGSWSAHFEHTIAITATGQQILTLPE
ncbi:MAG TPA: type I methionyl aminopeptidase [bacterium]|jgi:methionyl aminopeptidase|nr:type I methionyl aminopeptidase [bacterium]HNZ51268.1 type I methionyl aminopeptidase [bacterium]HOF79946.1 type I methionyl aminopeptidase [bacterium]HOH85163.1 type I methionyl aminopeptidase [bacterium]HOQ91579.1 type I methionyl aminopeptidase [bacterium]